MPSDRDISAHDEVFLFYGAVTGPTRTRDLRGVLDGHQAPFNRQEIQLKSLEELHHQGSFLLVNVYDVGSAVLAQAAGAEALGTTSAGHAYSIGRRDAAGALSREESVGRAAEICAATEIPLSVDAENGWGHRPEDVAETIELLAQAGASGASIEDWSGDETVGFYETSLAIERIEAAVEVAAGQATPFVICARADRIMHDGADAVDECLERLQAFATVGAGCLYAPGPTDEKTLRRFAAEAGGPINAMLDINGGVGLADAAAWGVRRVSVGSSMYQATMAAFSAMVRRAMTTGSLTSDPDPLDYEYIESLFNEVPKT